MLLRRRSECPVGRIKTARTYDSRFLVHSSIVLTMKPILVLVGLYAFALGAIGAVLGATYLCPPNMPSKELQTGLKGVPVPVTSSSLSSSSWWCPMYEPNLLVTLLVSAAFAALLAALTVQTVKK